MKRETYSVVIPAYNAEKTIGECLASILEQTFAPLEVIVVDDCSVDSTETAVLLYEGRFVAADIRFKYIRLDQNSGPSFARNKGIRESKGSFIAFLDADDTWVNNKLEVVNRFANESTVGLICHSYTESIPIPSDNGDWVYEPDVMSIYQLLLRNPAQTSCVVVRNQFAVAFDETMGLCEDYDLWMRIAENYPVLRLVGKPLTCLGRPQLSAGGLSGNRLSMRVGEFRVYYNFCRRNYLLRMWLLPNLLLFSVLKHVYSYVRRCG